MTRCGFWFLWVQSEVKFLLMIPLRDRHTKGWTRPMAEGGRGLNQVGFTCRSGQERLAGGEPGSSSASLDKCLSTMQRCTGKPLETTQCRGLTSCDRDVINQRETLASRWRQIST